jgi:RNA polymerase sigma-70 factor (ECF subfamily)
VLWLQPYPDELLAEIDAGGEGPEAAAVARETVELAFLVAIQHLPPLQRAVLIVRDVLGSSARETATLLETTVPAVNSALQRARATMRARLPEDRREWAAGTDATAAERALLERYVRHTEDPDPDGLKQLLHEDVRFWMPPHPGVWEGRDTVVDSWVQGGFGSEAFGSMRCLVTRANGQPAVACYARRPGPDGHRLFALDVLRIEHGAVAEIVTFDAAVLHGFDLPAVLA